MLGTKGLLSKRFYLLRIFFQSNLFANPHNSLHYDSNNFLFHKPKLYSHLQIRLYSEEEDNYFKGPPKRKSFIYRFMDNIREGMKSKEFQTSLKGLEEETAKMKQSKVLLTMKQRMETTKKFADKSIKSGAKFVEEKADVMRSASAEAFEKIKQSKGIEKTQEFAYKVKSSSKVVHEKISDQTKRIGETEVYKTVSTGATAVKSDLIDDILEESAPYKRPDTIRKRTDPSHFKNTQKRDVVSPDGQTSTIVVSQQSLWGERVGKLVWNNPVVNLITRYKMKYDESDNLIIRGARTITENVGDFFKQSFSQPEMSKVMTAMQSVDPHFTMESFIQQCKYDIIPNVLEAFLAGNLEVLKSWCHETAFNVLSAYFKQNYGDVKEAKILEIYNTDLLTAKMLDSIPVLVLMFDVQQLLTRKKGERRTEHLEKVRYIWALSRDLEIFEVSSSWRVLEFSIFETRPLLV